ncbi:class I SAM-dependent methyltransferase [Salipiger mangrovisoli]|uniref:Methyltransferase domain-containing protein n=1 Tax=Salipiger mangrovisoli TaxID=2865933 RepID=A0ABR9X149_9RHOB|nr:methyltransferase domain-containing protein [Salipiger mangrovisoli]MBE9637290.1 methyltransferase domain-containing protein [Salipiger mangrovisoli]
MEARLQTRIQRYGWDAAADHYHASWEAQLRPAQDRLLAMARIGPGQRVIETACGSGMVTARLAAAVGSAGHVLATDLSQGMIDDLRARLGADLRGTVTAARMAAETLDVPDESYDAAVCSLGLMYTPDPAAALREMARVVGPRGTVAATVWGERRNCGWADVFPIVDARVASEVCPLFFGTGAEGALKRLFEAAGLDQVAEVRQSETLTFASERALLDAVLLGGPVALAVKRFDAAQWSAVQAEFLASVRQHRQPGGSYGIPGEFLTLRGLRP